MTANNEKSYTIDQIRKSWIQYFNKQNHLEVASASLIPAGDPTLLFTTAGMVPFKNYFSGVQKPPASRVVSIQKCIRTTDLEEVGKTDRHCTFFEMLGNFSFGDYFKKEAIEFSWDFSLNVIGLSPDQICITVYEDDDEAFEIWNKDVGVPTNKITRLDKKDNWWGPAGSSGACGPCSELYLDRGATHCDCEKPDECLPGNDCDRYMEYWNLVFNQYNQDTSGNLHPLPQTGIDTGAGLERLAALLNGLDSVYDTDEMIQIINLLESLVPKLHDNQTITYDPKINPAPFRVIADHVRSSVFAIADGIYPDKTGRGYVIRRIIRRALLFARELGIHEPILCKLAPLVVQIYGERYPEIKDNNSDIVNKIRIEEERFLHTLEQGINHWSVFCNTHKEKKATSFDGKDAFTLYDTFGFPLEMTRELALKEGWEIKQKEFDTCMSQQQKRSSAASSWKDVDLPPDFPLQPNSQTNFIGYDQSQCSAKVVAILDKNNLNKSQLQGNEEGIIILDESVFYAEGGGQIGDTGLITTKDCIFEVTDTRKKGNWHLHVGKLQSGSIKVLDSVKAHINQDNRKQLERHHSATHLLNQSLRNHLGNHIKQTGSLVCDDYLRFDFSHPERISEELIDKIEAQVHTSINKKEIVTTEVLSLENAQSKGAVATFGEKYTDEVRVVSMGADGEDSMELCGGCHVKNTEEINLFHIFKESSPGAGNRRIEALAGDKVIQYFQNQLDQMLALTNEHNSDLQKLRNDDNDISSNLDLDSGLPQKSSSELLKKPSDALSLKHLINQSRSKIEQAQKKLIKFKKQQSKNKSSLLLDKIDDYINTAPKIGETTVIRLKIKDADINSIRSLTDKIKERLRGVVVLAAMESDKPILLFTADKKAVQAGINCANLIKNVAPIVGGGGGGKPDMAQAGGKDSKKIDEALDKAMQIIQDNE